MDDYDAYLYSIDDIDLFKEEEESDNDVLDNIDEEQADTHTAVVLVPASPPTSTHQTENRDEKPCKPVLTTSNLMATCDRVLTEKFGFQGYKGKQKEIIQAALSGVDVFVLAPTGMGKSLCFQVPAIAEDNGVSIVVSPLLALMKNQVTNLRSKGIQAASLTSETSKSEKGEIIRDLSSKHPRNRLFYTTPEKLCTRDLMCTLTTVHSNGRLSRLVIDEAHCISEWGHDFREEYRKLGSFREHFPGVPIMALTATATKNVQRDIIRSLKMVEDKLFTAVHPFNRENLYYEVRYKSAPESGSLMQDILDFIEALHRRRGRPSSGIIYCRKRETCDALSNYLRGKGLNARPYHRGINSKTLNKTLKEWEIGGTGEGGVDVVCATIAFGMGIDKSDVRYIIHYDLPKSMEGYYQETEQVGMGYPLVAFYTILARTPSVFESWCQALMPEDKTLPLPRMGRHPAKGQLTAWERLSVLQRMWQRADMSYFGEIIDTTDDDFMESICDKMCDVCKCPDKTRQRKTNLSDEDHAAAVISMSAWNAGYDDDDDDSEAQRPRQPPDMPVSVSTAVHKHQRDQDQKTLFECLASLPLQGFKRPNSRGRDQLVLPNSKKVKVEHARGEQSTTGTGTRASIGSGSSMPPPLITRPHRSASGLTKPFKTPFKVPLERPDPTSKPNNDNSSKGTISSGHAQTHNVVDDSDDAEIVEVRIQPASASASTNGPLDAEVDVPEIPVELEASFSHKVPLETRMRMFNALRKSLHRIFPFDDTDTQTAWDQFVDAPTSVQGRTLVVAEAAKRLEHAVHIMCATPAGYEERIVWKQRTITSLTDMGKGGNIWEGDDEDAREVLKTLKNSVSRPSNQPT